MEILKTRPQVCFEVEKVIGVSSDGSYQVQWAPAWVSKFHLVGCEHLIQEFLQQQNASHHNETIASQRSAFDSDCYNSEEGDSNSIFSKARTVCVEMNSQRTALLNAVPNNLNDTVPIDSSADLTAGSLQAVPIVTESPKEIIPESGSLLIKVESDSDDEEVMTTVEDDIYASVSMVEFNNSRDVNMGGDAETEHTFCTESFNEATIASAEGYNQNISYQHSSFTTAQTTFTQCYNTSEDDALKVSCHICHKKFRHKASLKNHLRLHSGEKPWRCEICGYTCAQKGDMNKHMRVHTGDKPYKCDLCQKSFSESGNMKRHMRTHDPDEPSKSFT